MGQPGGKRRTSLAVIAVAAAAGVSLLRQTGAGALDTVYAEDGAIFLAASYNDTELGNFFTPYAGYLHLGPRLITALVSAFPVSWAAWALAVSAAVVTGLLAVLVFFASTRLESIPARLLVSAVVVMVPVGQDELPNSIANLHWPALYALFWVLLWKPASKWSRAVAVGSVLLIALSDLLVLALVPLAIWLWWRRRTAHSLALMLALGAGLAAQAATVLLGPGGRELNPEPLKWAPWWVIRAVPTSTIGQRWFPSDVDLRWLVLAAFAWVLVGIFVFLTFKRTLTDRWQLAALAGAHCVALYALPVMLSGQATPRYAAAPAMLLVVALVALVVPSRPGVATIPPQPSTSALLATSSSAASLSPVSSPASASFGSSADASAASLSSASNTSSASYGSAMESSGSMDGLHSGSTSATGGSGSADAGGLGDGASAGPASEGRQVWREWGSGADGPQRSVKDKWAFGLLAGFMVTVWLVNLRLPNERSLGPTWSEQAAEAQRWCEMAPAAAQTGDGPVAQLLLASPGWSMQVSCEKVPSWR